MALIRHQACLTASKSLSTCSTCPVFSEVKSENDQKKRVFVLSFGQKVTVQKRCLTLSKKHQPSNAMGTLGIIM